MSNTIGRVVIGMVPHKRSVTAEVMTAEETVLGGGRFGTDEAGFAALRRYVSQVPDRVWAIEGCNGIGHHVAMRLLAEGEEVLDVPPKLSARTRLFATGQGRKTDATDVHSVAWSAPGWPACAGSPTTSSWRCCGSWSTAAAHWARTTPG